MRRRRCLSGGFTVGRKPGIDRRDGLVDDGIFLFTTGGLDSPHEKTDSSMGIEVCYGVLGIPKTLELLGRFRCVCRHLEYDQYPEQHLYIIAQKQSSNAKTQA